MSVLRDLIHEAHRRSIWQVLGIYVVGSWVSLQVVDLLVDSFGLPEWLPPFALALLVIGLPVVLATAFVQEGISGGQASLQEPSASAPGQDDAAHATHAAPSSGAGPSAPAEAPRLERMLTWRNAISGGVLAFAIWGVAATAFLLAGSRSAPDAASDADALQSIAVLPFDNLSPDPDNAYFADGIHEDVLTQLSKIGDLTVISRTSVMGYRDTDKTMDVIGDELGVGAIVEGSVRRAGDDVRITAQLIDARTDEHLWADNFDRRLSAASLFSIQSEIAQKIADALSATLTPTAERQITRTPTEDLAAYDFYLRGRTAYDRYTAESNEEAIRLFKEAISRDPSYADPYTGLADAYAQGASRYAYAREWADSAEAMANRALELAPELAFAHKALANAYTMQNRTRLALESNIRAIELDPSFSDPVNNAGVQYFNLGRFDEALRMYTRAYRLSPNTGFANSNAAGVLALLGFFDRAEQRARELLLLEPDNSDAQDVLRDVHVLRGELDLGLQISMDEVSAAPDDPYAHLDLSLSAILVGDVELTATHAREAMRLSPDADLWADVHHVKTMLAIAVRESDPEESASLLEEVLADMIARIDGGSEASWEAMEAAAALALMGRTEEALDWGERAYEMGFRWYGAQGAAPGMAPLADEPRWQTVMSNMERDIAEQRANVERWEAEGTLR